MKVLLVNHFPVWPPTNGGRIYTWNLARSLARSCDVTVLCIMGIRDALRSGTVRRTTLANRIVEVDVASSFLKTITLSPLYLMGYNSLDSFCAQMPFALGPFRAYCRGLMKSADIVIVEHPFLAPMVSSIAQSEHLRRRIVYDAVDVEFVSSLAQNRGRLLHVFVDRRVRETEALACRISERILVTNRGDKQSLAKTYQEREERITVIPVPVDTQSLRPPNTVERANARKALRVSEGTTLVSFVGSNAPHNLGAVKYLEALARQLRKSEKVRLYVGGSIASSVTDGGANVILGSQHDFGGGNAPLLLQASDVAISIDVGHGTGTPVKTLEYMAYGLPVVVTPEEASRTGLEDRVSVRVAEPDDMSKIILELATDEAQRASLGKAARRLIEQNHGIDVCGDLASRALSLEPA